LLSREPKNATIVTYTHIQPYIQKIAASAGQLLRVFERFNLLHVAANSSAGPIVKLGERQPYALLHCSLTTYA